MYEDCLHVLDAVKNIAAVNTPERTVKDIDRIVEMLNTGYINPYEACSFVSKYGCDEPYFDLSWDKEVAKQYSNLNTICKFDERYLPIVHAMIKARRSVQVFKSLYAHYISLDLDFHDYKRYMENQDWSDDWMRNLFAGEHDDKLYCTKLGYNIMSILTPKHYPGVYPSVTSAIYGVQKSGLDLSWLSDTRWKKRSANCVIRLVANWPDIPWLKYITPTLTTLAAYEIYYTCRNSDSPIKEYDIPYIVDYWKDCDPKTEFALIWYHKNKMSDRDFNVKNFHYYYDTYRHNTGLIGSALAYRICLEQGAPKYPDDVLRMEAEFNEVHRIPNDPVLWCRENFSDITPDMTDEDVFDKHWRDWERKFR